ncbi:MAG: hypothetical protein SV186_04295 [Candidatus Nanohaloarchaea archaeon]|nr:hypothetical protein [Candidatus Nanohaloarchaea archaeon]
MDRATAEACRNGFFLLSILLLAVTTRQILTGAALSGVLAAVFFTGQVAFWATYAYRKRTSAEES